MVRASVVIESYGRGPIFRFRRRRPGRAPACRFCCDWTLPFRPLAAALPRVELLVRHWSADRTAAVDDRCVRFPSFRVPLPAKLYPSPIPQSSSNKASASGLHRQGLPACPQPSCSIARSVCTPQTKPLPRQTEHGVVSSLCKLALGAGGFFIMARLITRCQTKSPASRPRRGGLYCSSHVSRRNSLKASCRRLKGGVGKDPLRRVFFLAR
jgi:hypothetical protein